MKKILLIIALCLPICVFGLEGLEEIQEKIETEEVVIKVGKTEKMELSDDIKRVGVIWETSDSTVAIVDEEGVVTAKGAGEATITANTTEGYRIEFQVKVLSNVSYYLDVAFTFFKRNLLAFEIIAGLGLIFVFIKLSY